MEDIFLTSLTISPSMPPPPSNSGKKNGERIAIETFPESCLISTNTLDWLPLIMFHISYRVLLLISFPESHDSYPVLCLTANKASQNRITCPSPSLAFEIHIYFS
eukprot:sb/3477973/